MSLSIEHENTAAKCVHGEPNDSCPHCDAMVQRLKMRVVIPSCKFVLRMKKYKHIYCGFPTESVYRIVTGISEISMPLCSKHATILQQQNPHWKFYRNEAA